jgi:hypothetical protein
LYFSEEEKKKKNPERGFKSVIIRAQDVLRIFFFFFSVEEVSLKRSTGRVKRVSHGKQFRMKGWEGQKFLLEEVSKTPLGSWLVFFLGC